MSGAEGTRTLACRIKSSVCCRYTTTPNVGRAYPFQSCWSMLLLLVSSGSPESRTQRYAVISRVRATGPRLPFANVVIAPVGTAGLEPALSCSQSTWAAATLHPVISQNGRI